MEAIFLIGIQGSGKSTFYKNRFFNTHLRISNDLLKTKNRVEKLVEYAIETDTKVVFDNTNFDKTVRMDWIKKLRQNRFRIIGYFFEVNVDRALEWNQKRNSKEIVPKVGILGTLKKLNRPTYEEGFDILYGVNISNGEYQISEWQK
ncbi:MAG: AAA family ATPase [Spirochaetota bacterium]